MRKFNSEPKVNGKKYSNELRQAVVNYIEYRLKHSSKSLSAICAEEIPEIFNISRCSGHRYFNALGNAAGNKIVKNTNLNIKPILESKYDDDFRSKAMSFAMRFGVPATARKYKVSNHTIYDWIKAYGWSTAYFNR